MRRNMLFLLGLLGAIRGGAAEIDFSHDIVPVLRKYCGECHTGNQKKGGLSLNTREAALAGGELGPAAVPGKSQDSELLQRITSTDDSLRMPPEGPGVPADDVERIRRWIDEGLDWESGFSFGERAYEPPLLPRRPELPPPSDGRANPIDRLIDDYLQRHDRARPEPISDATFARRVYLDLVGLLPTPKELDRFLSDTRSDKRIQLVDELLARDVDYAEHWLTFWNDLLRNDYAGTGFITGGRQQISKWLYNALVENLPYDEFTRQLISPPTPDSAGFIQGIRWRGDVSAGQTVEVQFAQSVGQSFLGINLKCASCHDSFIDRWKLEESYRLAAIYSTTTLEIHRCDKPIGKSATPGWLFPEIGDINPDAPQPERLKQLAALMTHPQNGRFTRTIVNRLWHRLMGRGIVHPTDAMQTEPWDTDLLDFLAVYLVDQRYDLKQVLRLITTSQAYQSHTQVVNRDQDEHGFVYSGPRARRMTAEQFLDAVWQITSSAPSRFDAPVVRGRRPKDASASLPELQGKWIWSRDDTRESSAGETVVFRKTWEQTSETAQAVAVVSCDNSYVLSLNGQRLHGGDNWESPDVIVLTQRIKRGKNELTIVGKNGGKDPNPAGLFCEVRLHGPEGRVDVLATDQTWEWTIRQPDANGRFKSDPGDWQKAVPVAHAAVWADRLERELASRLQLGADISGKMVRASLLKSDFLMRALGRPNRDQIVSVRPTELTTLEAIDLANGQVLADSLHQGAERLAGQPWESPAECVRWIYRHAIARDPSNQELATLTAALGPSVFSAGLEDVLWSVVMLPEFQLVR